MRLKLFFIQSLFIALTSCSKVKQPLTTSFQLICTDYLSGDTLPDIAFGVHGRYNSAYDFNQQTNAHGNFDTVFIHEHETDFEFSILDQNKYYLAKKSGNAVSGSNTMVELELMGISTLQYDFDCSGSGGIQNISHELLVPIPLGDPFYNNPNAQQGIISTASCELSSRVTVFSGEWIITYDHRPHISAPWTEISDTVSIVPGEDLIYAIIY